MTKLEHLFDTFATIENYGNLLARNEIDSVASTLFSGVNTKMSQRTKDALSFLTSNGKWNEKLDSAAKTLDEWKRTSGGREPAYTPEELALAQLKREIANHYHQEGAAATLLGLNALHQASIAYAMQESGLADSLIKAGGEGYYLSLVETSSRLAPVLTFPGASSYLCATVVPYAREARAVLGEKHKGRAHFISEDAVRESACSNYRVFKKALNKNDPLENKRELRVLVESSAAPRSTVPKSGRKPEVYIAHIDALPWEKEMTTVVDHYVIDTPFREEFDARVRELMFLTLRGMYQER